MKIEDAGAKIWLKDLMKEADKTFGGITSFEYMDYITEKVQVKINDLLTEELKEKFKDERYNEDLK